MIYKYGGYTHAANEVNLATSRIVTRDRRGNPHTEVVRHTIEGVLQGVGATAALRQADLTAKIKALDDAYDLENQDATLFHDDGTTRSHHFLWSRFSVDGVKVVSGPDYKRDENDGEYATKRSYTIVLEAEYLSRHGSLLVDWQESLTVVGDGGPRHVVRTPLSGSPVRQDINDQSAVRAIQAGTSTYLRGFYPFPGLLFSGAVIHDQISKTSTWSTREGKTVGVRNWSYPYWSASPLSGLPHLK